MITGDSFHPDLLLLTDEKVHYTLELTVGFETNIQNNSDRKIARYSSLINVLSLSYSKVVFVNISMGAIRVMGFSAILFCPYYMSYILIRLSSIRLCGRVALDLCKLN